MGNHTFNITGNNYGTQYIGSEITQYINEHPAASSEDKEVLCNLVKELNNQLQEITESQKLSENDVNAFSEKVTQHIAPKEGQQLVTGEGLLDAAKKIGEVAPGIISLIGKIVSVSGAFLPS